MQSRVILSFFPDFFTIGVRTFWGFLPRRFIGVTLFFPRLAVFVGVTLFFPRLAVFTGVTLFFPGLAVFTGVTLFFPRLAVVFFGVTLFFPRLAVFFGVTLFFPRLVVFFGVALAVFPGLAVFGVALVLAGLPQAFLASRCLVAPPFFTTGWDLDFTAVHLALAFGFTFVATAGLRLAFGLGLVGTDLGLDNGLGLKDSARLIGLGVTVSTSARLGTGLRSCRASRSFSARKALQGVSSVSMSSKSSFRLVLHAELCAGFFKTSELRAGFLNTRVSLELRVPFGLCSIPAADGLRTSKDT